jgi:glucokinase
MKDYLIGVDIGGTTVKLGKFNLDGVLLEKWDIPTNRSDHGRHIAKDVIDSIYSRVRMDAIKGIGLGVPGPVKDGIVLRAVNLGWGKTHLEETVRALLGNQDLEIAVGNDANVAAAGEVFQGAAKGCRNVVMLTLGTGVGGGIIQDGKLIEGAHGVGGEFGHIVIDTTHKFACNCGKAGCLETVTSATGIVNVAKKRLLEFKGETPLHSFESFSAKKVFDFAKAGDPFCQTVIDEVADYLAYALSIVTLSIDPDVILFGGGVSLAGEYLIEQVKKHFRPYVEPFIHEANFALATLGNDAGIYGAAYLVR